MMSQHEQIAALSDEAFVSALNRALGDDAPQALAVGPRASFPLRQSHAVDYIDEGLVLVADAAHSIHPLAGQGINLGLSDVRVLAEELTVGKAKGLAIDSPVVLKRYQRQRKTENLAMMAAMEGFKRGFGSLNPLAVIARNIGLGSGAPTGLAETLVHRVRRSAELCARGARCLVMSPYPR